MPELAAMYSVGALSCLTLTVIFIFLRRRRRRSLPFANINRNLKQLGLHWAENQDKIMPWTDELEEREFQINDRSYALAGGLLTLLSWGGVVFLLVIMLSERFLAQSRREKKLLLSPLAQQPLTLEETKKWAQEITEIP